MISITISEALKTRCPHLQLGILQSNVKVTNDTTALWEVINATIEERIATLQETSSIAQLPAIQSSRKGYKACGKDPARYRPSAESLLRRVIKGKGLYRVNNVVDLLNLVSIRHGYSIGGFDLEKIEGPIVAGIGKANEPYEGIGRGSLNMEYMPLLRDTHSAFGSPTSDSVRTCVHTHTSSFLMVFYAFDGIQNLEEAMNDAKDLLLQFGGADQVIDWIVST